MSCRIFIAVILPFMLRFCSLCAGLVFEDLLADLLEFEVQRPVTSAANMVRRRRSARLSLIDIDAPT